MLTIIITAYKEPKTLKKQLTNITHQLSRLTESAEILVCAPDLETQKVALNYPKNSHQIKLLKDQGTGKPAALNLALQEADGEILVLTDGDVEIGEKSIGALLKFFENPRIGAVSGRPISTNSRADKFGFWAYVLTEMAHKTRASRRKKGEYLDCSGYLYAIRAGLVKNIPENTLSDDALISSLIYNLGYEIAYAPEAKVSVKYPDNFRDWLKQKKRSTGGYAQNFPPARGGIKGGGRKGKMRGFRQEIAGIFQIFKYAKTPREFYWTILLIFARIILWLAIFWEIKIIKKPFDQMWQRVESTKNLP